MHVQSYGVAVRSSSVGYYLENEFYFFVNDRVKEIKKLTGNHQWRYCPTDTNPADILSRGISYDKFRDNSLWMQAPVWLTDDKIWPTLAAADRLSTPADERQISSATICNITTDVKPKGIATVIDLERINQHKNVLRVIAYVLQFVSNCRHQKTTDSLFFTESNAAALK